jgi:hypothetical protein
MNNVYATPFIYILYWKMFFLLRHILLQSNHVQVIYIRFYENYFTYNRSVVFGSKQLSLIYDIYPHLILVTITLSDKMCLPAAIKY